MRSLLNVLVAAAGLWLAAPAAAQLPAVGARSIRLSPTTNTQVGLWRMLAERTNFGVEAGAALQRQEIGDDGDVATGLNLTMAPSLKRYGAPAGAFATYLFGSLPLGFHRHGFGDHGDRTELVLGARAGAGLDWFPARSVSVGAHAGIEAFRASRSTSGTPDSEGSTSRVGTFGSGLSLHLYF